MNTNIHIRPFQFGDAPPVFQAIQESLAQVSQWLPDLNASLTLEEVQSYIESQPSRRSERKAYNFAIVDAHDNSILGGCGLTLINWRHRFANLYYWVRSSRTGGGIASAATAQLAHFGFETLDLQRIEIVVATRNPASIRVAEKVGAVREGILRNRITVNDTVHDAFMYSLIRSDLEGDEKPKGGRGDLPADE